MKKAPRGATMRPIVFCHFFLLGRGQKEGYQQPTDGPADGQALLQRYEDASKTTNKLAKLEMIA